jgi:hypothetical protein
MVLERSLGVEDRKENKIQKQNTTHKGQGFLHFLAESLIFKISPK